MKHAIFCIFLFCLLLVGQSITGQETYPCYQTLGTAEGIPSPETYFAMQASDGKMWFGTDNGAFSFDGYDIKTYSSNDGLNNAVVFYIAEDVFNNLWFSTMSGNVYIYYAKTDTFIPYKYNSILQKTLNSVKTAQFIQYDSKTKTLFSIANNQAIYRIDSLGNIDAFDSLDKTVMKKFNKEPNFTMDTIIDEGKNIYIAKISGDFKTRAFIYKNHKYPIFQVLELNGNEKLLLQRKKLSYCLNNKIQWSTKLPFQSGVLHFHNDKIFFPTLLHNFGLLSSTLENLRHNKFHKVSEKVASTFLTVDNDNGLWLCNLNNGIYYFPNDNISILNYPEFSKSIDFRSLWKTNDSLFISDVQNNVFLIDQKKHQVKAFPKVPFNSKKSVFFDQKNKNLWFGKYLYQNNSWKNIRRSSLELSSTYGNSKSQISPDSNYIYITGKNNFGIINLKTQSFDFLSNKDSEYVARTFSVFEDFSQQLWVGNNKGLFKWKDNNIVQTSNSLIKTRVEEIKQLSDSTLVIATKGDGIILFKGDSISHVTKANGLLSNLIENIAIDSLDNIWAGTMKGISIIERTNEGIFQIQNLTTYSGLPSNEIHQIIPGNPTWIATSKGLVRFNNDTIHYLNDNKPNIHGFYVNDHKELESNFNYNQNNISISFSTYDYQQQDNMLYRYRLNSISKYWIQTQNRKIDFLGLPPNKYSFEVQSKNNQNIWSDTSLREFIIQKPFWELWIFRFFILGSFSGIIFWNFRKIKRENDLNQRVNELEKQALQAQINPHFIFNVLNAIQNSMLQNDIQTASRNLSKFAKLIRSTLHFVTTPYISLDEEIESLNNYLTIEQMRFDHSFSFNISLDKNIDAYSNKIPPMIIQPYVENAVQHGMSANKKGEIEILISETKNYIVVKIIDNGPGFTNTTNLIDESHQSVGMSITSRRLQLINDDSYSTNSIQIMDRKDGKNNSIGTIVQIKIKCLA